MLTPSEIQSRKPSWKKIGNELEKKMSAASNLPRPALNRQTSFSSLTSTVTAKLGNFASHTKASLARDNSQAAVKTKLQGNASRQPSWGSSATARRHIPLVPQAPIKKKTSLSFLKPTKASLLKTVNTLRPHPDVRKL